VKSVIVYVEGGSDKLAMEALLRPIIERKAQQGVSIQFFEAPPGDKKVSVIRKVPLRAALILLNDPHTIVIAMPDLYPLNKEIPHETADELFAAIQFEFKRALHRRGVGDDQRYIQRFKVFCFKYELEALLLAAEDALAARLSLDQVEVTWTKPVEDQNKDNPPKQVLQALFEHYGTHYIETADAPLLLGLSELPAIKDACPQQFKPFVDYLESLSS
jgi:hypothetical protein